MPNGQFYNHYGYDEQHRFAMATAGGFATFEDAEAALRSHRPNAEKVMEKPEEVHAEPVPDARAGQTRESENLDNAVPTSPETAENSVTEPTYKVGDTVYLDDTAFIVEEIGLSDVQLRDPTLAYPIFRSESKENFEGLLWTDVRNAKYLPNAKIVTQRPNYEITVSILDAPTLNDRMREAGISAAQFIHDNGDVTFSFAESDKDAVERLASDLRVKPRPTYAQNAHKSGSEQEVTAAETIHRSDKNGLPFDVVREENPFADVEKWATDYQSRTEAAIAALEPEQRRIVDAMQTAGFFYDPLSTTALDPLIFRSGDLTGGYPLSFKTWDEAYAFIDGAELKDTPGLREQVQASLHSAAAFDQTDPKLNVKPTSVQGEGTPQQVADRGNK